MVKVCVFGALAVIDGDRRIERLHGRTVRELLALLALAPGLQASREALLAQLWPGVDPQTGRNRLSVALSTLRNELRKAGQGSVLKADRTWVWLDSQRVASEWSEYWGAIRQPDGLDRAVDLHRGLLLPEVASAWVERPRREARKAFEQALRALIERAEESGDWMAAANYSARLLEVAFFGQGLEPA